MFTQDSTIHRRIYHYFKPKKDVLTLAVSLNQTLPAKLNKKNKVLPSTISRRGK